MKIRWFPFLGLFSFLGTTHAQELASLYPAGGQKGTTVEVVLEGKTLPEVRGLHFSHPGITAQKLKGNRFSVALPKEMPEGEYDVWAVTAKGVTNARQFVVGTLPEMLEKESNDDPKNAQSISSPMIVNGTLAPAADRDTFRFEAKKGQRITFHYRSETLDGSARPALTVIDPMGKEILRNDGRDAEPFLDFEAAEAGSYLLRVEERSYQAGDNNVYRLAMVEGPRLIAAFPSVLERGKRQPVALTGQASPGEKIVVEITAPEEGAPDGGGWIPSSGVMLQGFRYHHPATYGSLRFGLAKEAVVREIDEPHSGTEKAQAVPLPVVVAGRFLSPREIDWYRFSAKKGETLWIETSGERAGQAMDIEMAIHDAKGNPLETLTGTPPLKKGEQPPPFPIRSADPMGTWKAPADGDYFLVVRDFFGTTRWGVNRGYELRIGKAHEEVGVVVVPVAGGLAAVPGGAINLSLAAIRRGGHEGAITIRAIDLPNGLEAEEYTLPAKQTTGSWTIKVDKDAKEWVGRLNLLAKTVIDGEMQTFPVLGLSIIRVGQMRRTDGIAAAILAK